MIFCVGLSVLFKGMFVLYVLFLFFGSFFFGFLKYIKCRFVVISVISYSASKICSGILV